MIEGSVLGFLRPPRFSRAVFVGHSLLRAGIVEPRLDPTFGNTVEYGFLF